MEPLFENSHLNDKAMLKEFYGYFFYKSPVYIALYIIMGAAFISSLAILILDHIFTAALILAPLCMLLPTFRYFHSIKVQNKRNNEISSTPIEVKSAIFEDYIENTSSNGALTRIEFNKIKSAVQTKNLIMLRSDAKLVYVLRKDTFTKGTKEEFVAFLKSKGIKTVGK